jgi:C4-dicarboxylate-specific signal transduction histidine kinase
LLFEWLLSELSSAFVRITARGDAQNGPVDIELVLRDVQTLLRHDAITRGISLRLMIPDRLAGIIGQRTRLTQLLINLVIGAFDAVDESGSSKRSNVCSAVNAMRSGAVDFLENPFSKTPC